MTALALVKKAVTLGVENVQIGDNLPLHKLYFEERATIELLAKESGIRIKVGTRRLTLSNIKRYIHITSEFQSGFCKKIND